MREGQKRDIARALRREATDAERLMWRLLRARHLGGTKFRRQVPIGPFVADFACAAHRLVIELDGGQHADSRRDEWRDGYLRAHGWRVLRFWNNDVLGNAEGVLESVLVAIGEAELERTAPSPGFALTRSATLSRLREREREAASSGRAGRKRAKSMPPDLIGGFRDDSR